MTPGPVDPQAVAALNAEFAPRWQALWAAVQAAASTPPGAAAGSPPRIPAVAAAPPGDRRFAAPEWDELPYFALLKQSYLLAGEYAQRLPPFRRCPRPSGAASRS